MRSCHHEKLCGRRWGERKRGVMLTLKKETDPPEAERKHIRRHINAKNSPPASFRQSLGVHPAHVAHANQPDGEVFHPRRNAGGWCRSHCACCPTRILKAQVSNCCIHRVLSCLLFCSARLVRSEEEKKKVGLRFRIGKS